MYPMPGRWTLACADCEIGPRIRSVLPAPLRARIWRTVVLAAVCAAGCGDGEAPTTPTPTNRAPESAGSIPGQTLHVGDTAAVDLSSYFADADGDVLSYAAASSAAAVVSVSVSGATLTVAAVGTGSATVTVTATDPAGLSAAQTFQATVPNRAPEAAGAIEDRTVLVGDTARLDVTAYFIDPDGDALSYAASSSDPAVAEVSVSGSEVTIAALSEGSATVEVTATDSAGLSAELSGHVAVVTPVPDLAFTAVSPASATLTPGDSATFTFGVRNQGTGVSGPTTIRAMRSPNPIMSGRDQELRSWSFPSLAPSQDHAFPVTISVGADSAPGTIYIGMCVDALADESDTRNNCSEAARLTIAASSNARQSVGADPLFRIRVSRPRRSKSPAASRRERNPE